jgi:DNA-binding CsgD family transcriptional regulator
VDQLERALTLHDGLTVPFERARTEFCLGERLRREGHRTDARAHLTAALLGFERLGAEPWAVWARRELVATGQTARRRQPSTADELTPQELQVAVIVAGGATNKEAAAQLFVSPKTIETHLLRTYRKLGIRSRKGLTEQLRVGQDQ